MKTTNLIHAPSVPASGGRSAFDNPAILWLLVATGLHVLYPLAALRDVVGHLTLPDTDDAMRLVQVRDLLAGQGWFDMVQKRLMPPEGASMHWSRLVDAPLAGLIALGAPWLGRPLAEGLVAALWPPALFGLYLVLVYRAVRARFGFRAALLSLFAATQAGGLGALFAFGRIDHHNVQVLLILALGLCVASPERSARRAALGGMAAATSLAVGLEALPFIALAGLFLTADWIRAGRTALPALGGFALTLAAASLVLFAGQTDPDLWATTQCDALSPPWLWLTVAAGALAYGATRLGPRLGTWRHRAGFAAVCGGGGVAGFALLAPRCLSGPFQNLPVPVRTGWLDHVLEMQPFHRLVVELPGDAFAHTAPLLLAGLVAIHAALRGRPDIRRGAALAAMFLLTGFLLAQFQFRGIYMAAGFIALVAGPVLDHAVALLRRPVPTWRRVATLSLALSLIARVWVALLSPFGGGGAEAEVARPMGQTCRDGQALAALDAVAPGLVLAPVNLGTSILLYSRHAVVAAPYHRAIAGLTASVEGLQGDEAALKRALGTSGATYLAVCTGREAGAAPGPMPFARRLAEGTATAPWLERLPPTGTPLALWRVRPAEGGTIEAWRP